MTWSAEQHRLLEAMDLQPMQRIVPGQRLAEANHGMVAEPAPRYAREPAASTAAQAPVRDSLEMHPALRQALQRAAGSGDISALVGDLERLRREPALKRALWPRLRAFRRSH